MNEKMRKIFDYHREAVLVMKDNEIIWHNKAAEAFFVEEASKKSIEKYFAGEIASRGGDEDFAVSTNAFENNLDAVVSKMDDEYIISILVPENAEMAEFKNMMSNIENSVRNTMALFNMASVLLQPTIDKCENEKISMYAAIQKHSYYSLAYIVNNLSQLCISREELTDWDKIYFDVVRVCRNLLSSAKDMAKPRGISIDLQSDKEQVVFFGKEELIYLALMKLLSNSLKYVEGGGKITVSVKETDETMYLSVEDDGCGIEPEKLMGIFSKYRMNTETYGENKEGVGIGLYIVNQIAEMHKGKVSIESKVGVGTKVTLELPMLTRKGVRLNSRPIIYSPTIHDLRTEFADALDYKSYLTEEIRKKY